MNKYDKYIQLLKANKNLIFTGAPGTGKTHLAKEIAGEMVEKTFRPLDRITDKEIADYLKPRLEIESVSKNVQYQIDRVASREVYLSGKTIQNKRISFEDIIDAYHNKLWEMGKARSLSTAKIALAHYIYRERSKRLKTQIEVVQFHPSYDYTDFVEGLRPVKHSDKDTICFERRDGIFKSFCKEASMNYKRSRMSPAKLQQQSSLEEKMSCFLSTAIEQNKKFFTKKKSEFYIYDVNEKTIFISIPANEKMNELRLNKKAIFELLDKGTTLNNVKDIREYYGRNFNLQQDTYLFSLCKGIESYRMNEQQKTVQPVALQNYIFIIDEINRGEVSKIFGELFSCIDPEYRGERGKVTTQYANLIEDDDVFKEGFYVPENVYIIATMNDIDRSVESMDFAFRRRFAWKEIEVEETLEDIVASIVRKEWREEAVRRLTNLNDAITKDERLGKAYNIGGSYLLKLNSIKENEPKAAFEQLWNYHIENVLREYLRGLPISEISRKVEDFKQAYQ
jgi:hypothetical protein